MFATLLTSGCGRSKVERLNALPTPAWQRPGALSLRADGDELYLRHSDSAVLYAYDRKGRALRAEKPERWSALSGTVTDCDTAGRSDPKAWRVDPERRLLRSGAPAALRGARALLVRLAPRGSFLAALSAEGGGKDSTLPGLGGAPVEGPLYHEVLATSDGRRAGDPLQLPEDFARQLVLACWSPDERDVVYHDRLFTRISVAAFASPKKEPS